MERLLGLYNTRTILGGAMLEGAAFFALVTYMVERDPVGLAGAILLILGVALHFPTRSRVIRWSEEQLELLKRERQFAG